MDGDLHHYIFTKKGGVLDKYRQYYSQVPKKFRRWGDESPACQIDRAGGHAVAGDWHKKIERNAASGDPAIWFHTQDPNSPELNLCDLGLWPQLTTPIKKAKCRTVDEMWVELQRAFWAIEPDALGNLGHLKTAVCIQVHKAQGGDIAKEAHGA